MVEKWRILLKKYVEISFFKLSNIYLASDFVNLFFFGTLGGELYKILQNTKNKKSIFLTSLYDRAYSFSIYILFSIFLFLSYFLKNLTYILIFFIIVILSYIIYLKKFDKLISIKLFSLLRFAKLKFFDLIYHNFISILYILTYTFRVWFIFLIFGYNIDFYSLIIFCVILVIGISIPISIQGIGVREWLFFQLGLYLNISLEIATSAAILLYIISLIYRISGIIPFFKNKIIG